MGSSRIQEGKEKKKWASNQKQKNQGFTELEKRKNKPLQMVRPKKNKESKNSVNVIKQKIKGLKNQLGKFRKGKKKGKGGKK